jgi:hypothetical protein
VRCMDCASGQPTENSHRMDSERSVRRLAAIFSAKVGGFRRLMAEDETATVERLKSYRDAICALT